MDGVSEAAAVLGVVQLGFSLATTLNTYIADIRDGPEDIANLANQIEATVIHIEELNRLILENKNTRGWNENGVKLAKSCCSDLERSLFKLQRLFSKAGAGIASNIVTRDDIDISVFSRLTWPAHKERLACLKQELVAVKLNILFALALHEAHVGYGFAPHGLTVFYCFTTAAIMFSNV